MKTVEDVQTWRGMKMVDADGDKIGTIEDIFLDRQTGEPAWAAVKTGLFGRKHALVPIREAEVAQDESSRALPEGAGQGRPEYRSRRRAVAGRGAPAVGALRPL